MSDHTSADYLRAADIVESLPRLVIGAAEDRGMSPADISAATGVSISVLMNFADDFVPSVPSALRLLRWLGSTP